MQSDPPHRRPGKRLKEETEYRAEIGYCTEHAIPHSIFLGRPWPSGGESLWLDEDRIKVLEFLSLQSETCGRCGTREEQVIDLKTRVPLDIPEVIATTYRCPGCEEMEAIQAGIPPKEKGVGVRWEFFDPEAGDEDAEEDSDVGWGG